MAKKEKENVEYKNLIGDLKAGTPRRLYMFCGEERYLLEHYIGRLRARIPQGTEEFNHKRFDGKNLTVDALSEAVDALPVFSDNTLVEIRGFDFQKASDDMRQGLYEILSNIPEEVCVVFVSEGAEFKLDGRIKINAAIKKLFTVVDFQVQQGDELTRWAAKHVQAAGKKIDRAAAEHLVFVTGGLMTSMSGEIEKLCAYAQDEYITRDDIDAVVTPVLDAAVYELTDLMLAGKTEQSLKKLSDLLSLNEAPHKILYSVGIKLRQLLGAKLLQSDGGSIADLMEIYGIKYEFQAKSVFSAARRQSLTACRNYVLYAADTAYKLNSTGQNGGELIRELIMRMAIAPEKV